MKPLAIIPVYNEADILPYTIGHLLDQGFDIHLIDNWSSDSFGGFGHGFAPGHSRVSMEKWPASGPLPIYDWTGILKRIEEVALQNQGRWIVFHDADEVRRPPAKDQSIAGDSSTTLAEALATVERHGYNAVQYRVMTFKPIDNGYRGDPEKYFRHYSLDGIDSALPHIKTWIQGPQRVDLHTHGGHQAMFAGRQVFPVSFVLKHYPIRTQEQGERKLFRDRLPRYPEVEKQMRWHEQYSDVKQGQSFICDPAALLSVDA